jgi:signal transduction histidine kinase/ActR/RegA family two-component response regulator
VRVDASGEVAVLKDKLNEMIRNLRETTQQNVEQDWLKTNRERFTRMLQGQRDLDAVSGMILSELAPLVSAQHGVFYSMTQPLDDSEPVLEFQSGYGYEERKHLSTSFRLGQGLIGQCAKEKKRILLTQVPDDYVRISSGLGDATPLNIIVLPILFEGAVRAVVELASFSAFSPIHQTFLDQLTESVGLVLNTIEADTLTENLLKQSQSLAEELRSQQAELTVSNEDLGRQARLLAEQNEEAERKNREVEESKRLVEEKVGQLAVSSKYKSEFIANMSHELRTPLNSLLILAEQLEDNPDHNLTPIQVEYASVIRSSGKDLLELLNGILELAKVESGTIQLEQEDVRVTELRATLLREFEPIAQAKGLAYTIDVQPDCPQFVVTDLRRLRQILKNLLANAFKFTRQGQVHVEVGVAAGGWSPTSESLARAASVVALRVSDTGIGIDDEQQHRIFEAFAQGDGTTARLYGGTGLGLSISRELVSLLGGEITVSSTLGLGSSFTVYLPSAEPATAQPVPAGARATSPQPDQPDAVQPFPTGPAPAAAPALRTAAPVVVQPLLPRQLQRAAVGIPARTRPMGIEGLRVLLIDDDYRNLFALTALLERGKAEVTVAESGGEALAVLARMPEIEAILTDIMMPGMDGYATIRAIRQLDHFTTVPIIAVTGKVVPGERQRCLDAGANDYVPKPVDSAELLATLSPWLPHVRRAMP